MTGLDENQQRELAKLGVYLELTALNHLLEWGGLSYETVVERVRSIGARHFVLSSDLGQKSSGEPWDRFATELTKLLNAGLRQQDLEIMLQRNPHNLLS